MKLKGSCRSSAGIPCGIRLTGNPGGPGHHWVKARYIDPAPKGYLVIEQLERSKSKMASLSRKHHRPGFIPAKLKDNKELLRNDPGYVQRLRETGSAALVKAWLEGDWDGVDGTFFSEFSEESTFFGRPPTSPIGRSFALWIGARLRPSASAGML